MLSERPSPTPLHRPGDFVAPTAPQPAGQLVMPAFRFKPGRLNDNEAILFDEAARESWIIYPPRSAYAHLERPTANSTIVEHHPWAPLSANVFHRVTLIEGCGDHGLECDAFAAVKAAAELGWNAFR